MWPSARPWPLLALLALASHAGAVRSPKASTIGADLLSHTAEECDVAGAFRLMNTSSFSTQWLTRVGSRGERPLASALRSGCAQVAALIVLHPGFDRDTIRRKKQRQDLAKYALQEAEHEQMRMRHVQWAILVLHGIHTGSVAKKELELNPEAAETDYVWFLPEPGEWFAPASLEEMGLSETTRPVFRQERMGIENETTVYTPDGVPLRVDDVRALWYLMVGYIQSAEGSARRQELVRHIRSIGWKAFFSQKEALTGYARAIYTLANGADGSTPLEDLPPPEAEVHSHLRAAGLDVHKEYSTMPFTMAALWNKTGDFLFAP